jgi:hypothetical protein
MREFLDLTGTFGVLFIPDSRRKVFAGAPPDSAAQRKPIAKLKARGHLKFSRYLLVLPNL